MARTKAPADVAPTAAEAFNGITLDDLRPLAALVEPDPPKKKTDLVPLLARVMTDPARVRALYDRLDALSRNAVRVATFDPAGRLDRVRFRARFGEDPRFSTADPNREDWQYTYAERRQIRPALLRLLFPRYDHLPTDTRAILREFVPPPEPFAVPTLDVPPDTHPLTRRAWTGWGQPVKLRDVPVRVRETAAEAEADVRAVLRLIEAGKVRVTDKKLVPTEATRQAVAGVLAGGDFYAPDEAEEWKHDPAFDLAIKAFAWPALVQAGGLAEKFGDALKLTPAGRRALTAEPADVLRKLWAAWLKTRQFDEFAQIDAIKGQGRAEMSAAAGRRKVVAEALADGPVGRWFAVEDFFRFLRATGRGFPVSYQTHELYISEHYYGNLGYSDEHEWEQLQGRFALAFLFEYAAPLGLIDVAYVPPQGVRNDYQSRWGADDLSCLSRYDGLLYLRVNPLGAWALGLADEYRRPAPVRVELLRVLANRDVVAAGPLPAADRLTLDRYAEAASDGVWKLSADKVLGVVEQGGTVDELAQFLESRAVGGLPDTVATFLADLRTKAGRLTDAGRARLIGCADEHVAAELAADRQLKGKCLRAGDRHVVVRDADLEAVRKAVRRLGYVWPVPPE